MKPNFKKDISNVFFKEFSERVDFCGIRINAIITDNIAEGLLNGRMGREHDDYLVEFDKKVSYRSRDLPQKPAVNETIEINKVEYCVKKIWERFGVTNILISRIED
ncbi:MULTISPECIES: hypothetical protein [unclassified Fusobacterium]|uniref:hypothetical protein n=1 Tax=unclassified Fusobacterium TaxID=2648384 RepID=UPI001B8B2FB5|nr:MULTISPECIES: hypothetical protein [unclassified Fusobacterium]MBR8701455.1 hypothetical protein [Fusobacterium sp. DD45]MBR8711223.1 hypothetical protein [Fusobacterium sp. DD28]MBR8751784.1 hypothetical protein [Fusobacterium sp. DD26]